MVDRQALYEAYLVATLAAHRDDPALPSRAADRQAAAPTEPRANLDELVVVAVAVLGAGLESCPHGQPIGIDLSLPHPIEPLPGLTIRGDGAADGGGLRLLVGPVWGAGSMPWTRALLEAVAGYVRAGDRVADVGAGSGILGLYAARLGARAVDAVDTDALAAIVTARNARVNGLSDRVRAYHGSTEMLTAAYDVGIVSLRHVTDLPPVLAATAARLRPGGTLIASPADGRDERLWLERLTRGLGVEPLDRIDRDGWSVSVGRV